MALKRELLNTALPYRSFSDITSDQPNLVQGSQNILTTAQQLMEKIPGFSDAVEATPTTFSAAARNLWWVMWGGTRFLNIVCDVAGGFAKVYKLEVGVDANYVLIFTSSTAIPFDFVVSSNVLYMGNNTDMRKYTGNGSTTQKWGITRPSAIASLGTTGAGISAFSGFWYRDTYGNSVSGHQSSASDLSPCTGIVTNKTITIPLATSADTQVDQIHLYRTTDGGSTAATDMREITGSPFPNIGWTLTAAANASAGSTVYTGTPNGGGGFASSVGQSFTVAGFTTGANNGLFPCTAASATTITLTNAGGVAETHAATGVLTANDTTTDVLLSIVTAPSTTSNDPPTPSSKLCAYSGRIFTAANSTSYASGDEELPSLVCVPEECFPSGADGNNKSWAGEVTSQRPMADGVAVWTRDTIWKIAGTMRDNFIYPKILDRRGCLNHNVTAALGNSVAWLDTASQVFLDGQEIGFDIRQDIKNIDHSQAYMAIHIQGRFHWVCLLDGANGKLYLFDIDTKQWMPPKVLPAAASALSSGISAASTISLTVALGKTKIYKMNSGIYNDGGVTYSPVAAVNLLRMGEPDGQFEGVAVETDSHIPSNVYFLPDDDPTTTTPPWQEITATATDPVRRAQGVNLVKKIYQAESYPYCERAATKIVWPTADNNFVCYTIIVNPPLREVSK